MIRFIPEFKGPIDPQVARAFNKAVTNLDNIYPAIPAGESTDINWNFVQADCYMDSPVWVDDETGFLDQFNYLVRCYIGEITLASRIIQEAA
jgi:hypothetical protein|tara:strand:+ start:1143 stop:1418 length:276 start_codon:yes stop_codon:yes gene_type:complete